MSVTTRPVRKEWWYVPHGVFAPRAIPKSCKSRRAIPLSWWMCNLEALVRIPRSGIGFLDTQHRLRTLLSSVQKPRERIPAIAAIYDAEGHLVSFDDRSGPDAVAEVCYGTSTEDVTGKMERRYRKRNGLWTRPKRSSLDAIFVIAARYFEDEEPGSLVWGYLSQSDEAAIVKTVMRDCVDRWVGPDDWQRR